MVRGASSRDAPNACNAYNEWLLLLLVQSSRLFASPARKPARNHPQQAPASMRLRSYISNLSANLLAHARAHFHNSWSIYVCMHVYRMSIVRIIDSKFKLITPITGLPCARICKMHARTLAHFHTNTRSLARCLT